MKIDLRRYLSTDKVTLGEVSVDDAFECYSLEDPIREVKVFGDTCIPPGIYKVIVNYSPRLGKLMPRLLDVMGFTGILIHAGNGPEDTMGCILVGGEIKDGRIAAGTSRPAFEKLFEKIKAALAKGETVTIEVHNPKEV